MRIAPLLSSVILLLGATASAHEPSFRAVWIQPVPVIVTAGRALILPLGFHQGLGPWADFVAELTPYSGGRGECSQAPCRERVYGLVAAAGASFGRPLLSTKVGEIGWFVSPKLLAAVANETGTPGDPEGDFPFVPGVAYDLGGGVDFGIEVHATGAPVAYASVMIGFQVTATFNGGRLLAGLPTVASLPIQMVTSSTYRGRQAGPSFWASHNPNLLRIGLAF